jgi:subfamily B ATP-binding cassette protein MsbA
MLALYWRVVFRNYLLKISGLLVLWIIVSGIDLASIGMLVPVVALITAPSTVESNILIVILHRIIEFVGLPARVESVLLVGLFCLAVLLLFRHTLVIAQNATTELLSQDASRTIKLRLFGTFLKAKYEVLTGRQLGAIAQDVNGPAEAMHFAMENSISAMAMAIRLFMTVSFLLYLSLWSTLILGAACIIGMLAMKSFTDNRVRPLGKRMHELLSDDQALLIDTLSGIRVLKIHNLQDVFLRRLHILINSEVVVRVWFVLLRSIPYGFFDVFGVLLLALLLLFSMLLSIDGLNIAVLAAFTIGVRSLIPVISNFNAQITQLSQQMYRISLIEKTTQTLPLETFVGKNNLPPVKQIQIDAVTFTYPERADKTVLRNVSLTLKRGQVTALVGLTGAGKTTIADLLVRFYHPDTGRILVDGTNVDEYALTTWREHIGYVGQDAFLFNATVRENITLWQDVPQAEVERASQAAQLQEFVLTLPQGYETPIGDRGVKLSGGQRQRLAIARAILRSSDVLIFDEATSALDNLTEHAVHNAIGSLRANAIVLLIAHRLSTVKDADQIIVLKGGQVVEVGTYQSLLSEKSFFWELYRGVESTLEKSRSYAR